MLLKRLVKIFTSLRLTVILLAFAIVLVFIGTLAQVDEGLYNAQARYFRQWLIFGLDLFGHKIPIILPGGYLIGTMLLVNLVCRAHLSFSTFGQKNRHPTYARRRHSAARRPTCDRYARARIANQFRRGPDQIVCRKPAQLRTGFHERGRCEQRASRRHSRTNCSRAAAKFKIKICRSPSA